MVPTSDPVADRPRASDGQGRARQYTPGFSDGLGDRLLTFHYGSAASLELLRFKQEFSDSPVFEAALRTRVEQLSALRHPSIAVARTVERIEAGKRLALVSNHISGRRLSELLDKARGAVFAIELIQQLTPALVALHHGGAVHGALTAERIVVTRSGLVIVEHVLGAAIESMRLPPSRLRSELGIAVADGRDPVTFDTQGDLAQLGFVALSLLLGRKLDPTGGPATAEGLLDELTRMDEEGASAASHLRRWIERALQLGNRPFASALEAQIALHDLEGQGSRPASEAHRTILAFHTPQAEPAAPPVVPPTETAPMAAEMPNESEGGPEMNVAGANVSPEPPAPPPSKVAGPRPVSVKRRVGTAQIAAAALGVLSIVEGIAIVTLLYRRPAPLVVEARPLHDAALNLDRATPLPPPAEIKLDTPAVGTVHPEATPPVQKTTDAPPATRPEPVAAAAPAAPLAGRFGGIKLSSPIELQVFEGGALVGSTATPIAVAEGTHQLELVNETLGYRTRQTANVKAGQLTTLAVTVPNGRVSINAAPWADVWVDGVAAGQTPLANLSLPIGQHEVVFKHPQLGEQHQTMIVKAEGLTRVSVNLQK